MKAGDIVPGRGGKFYRYLGGPEHDKSSYQEYVQPEPVTLPNLQQSMKEELATRGAGEKFLAGAGAALDRAAYGAKSLFTDLSPQEKERLDLNKAITSTPGGALGQITGDVAMTTPAFGFVGGLASTAPRAGGRLAIETLGSGALGAGYGALTTPENRKTGAVVGGAGAAGGALVGGALRGLFMPTTKQAAELSQRGVPLTMGQASGGMVKRVEDAFRGTASKVPARQAEALEKWSQGVVQSAAPKVPSVSGAQIPKGPIVEAGRDAISKAASLFDDAYDDAFAKIGTIKADNALPTQLRSVVQTYGPKLVKSDADELVQQINRIGGELTNGIKGRAMKDLRSSYQKLADKAFTDGNGRLGEAYKAVVKTLNSLVTRQYPEGAKAVSAVDKQYAQFLPVQRAAGKIGAEEGIFSPSQLKAAVRELDKSVDKRQFARGATRPALLSEAEKAIGVLGPTIPPVGPGTAEKLAIPLAAQNWATIMPALATQGLYTKPAQRFLTGAYPWQGAIDPAWAAALGGALSNR